VNHVVKLLTDDDGEPMEPFWHLVVDFDGSPRALCNGVVFGFGEGAAEFEDKKCQRGITCPNCRSELKFYKSIKL